jgi:hypothetical protein
MSRALMIHLSIERQYSGDSYFREQIFVQTHSHGTFLWVLMPVSVTLASQELLRPSPKSRSPCDVFSANEGDEVVPQGILTAAFSTDPVLRFTGDIQWLLGERAHSQAAAASTSKSRDRLWWRGLQQAGRRVRFLGFGDLTTPVIGTATLGLACLPISYHLKFGLLAYWSPP